MNPASRHVRTAVALGGAMLLALSSGASIATAAAHDGPDVIAGDRGHSATLEVEAQAATNFPATADLDGRSGPSLSSSTVKVNAYLKGGSVPVVCQTNGGEAYGSTIWDHTSAGYHVADAYVKTGYSGFHPDLPRCTDDAGSTVKGIDIAGYQGANFDFAGQYASGVPASTPPASGSPPQGADLYDHQLVESVHGEQGPVRRPPAVGGQLQRHLQPAARRLERHADHLAVQLLEQPR